jgi:hypothetical protein
LDQSEDEPPKGENLFGGEIKVISGTLFAWLPSPKIYLPAR